MWPSFVDPKGQMLVLTELQEPPLMLVLLKLAPLLMNMLHNLRSLASALHH